MFQKCHLLFVGAGSHPKMVIASYPLGPTMSRTGANQNFWGKSKEARKGWRATAQVDGVFPDATCGCLHLESLT